MKMSLERKIYIEIQKKIFSVIPENWDKILLYSSVADKKVNGSSGELYFYYIPKGLIKKKPVNCYEIPNLFNVDEIKYEDIISNIYNLILNLRKIYIKKYNKKWSNITIQIKNDTFIIEYGYENLSNSMFNSYERHIIWKYLYLKTDMKLFTKQDKKIIEQYMNIGIEESENKEIYQERMYEEPVKTIFDYEKVLSVEEAIAQSEENEEVNSKKFFSKKKKYNNSLIEEIDENEGMSNNQILKFKK